MHVLVTGQNGYIGTVLTPLLVANGHMVVGSDTNLFKRCAFKNHTPYSPCLSKDIRDLESSDLKGFDALIHLAGLSNDPLGDLNPEITYQINHTASVRLAHIAKQAGIERFLFASSCSLYGATNGEVVNEESEFAPLTPYASSKMFVEQDVSELADDSFSPTYLRNATAYGVSPLLRFDLVLNNLVAWAHTTGKIFLKSDGTSWRPLVHIKDIAQAFLDTLHAPRELIHDQAFNVGVNEENYRISDLAEIVKNLMPGCEIVYSSNAKSDKRSYRVDCSKIAEVLNFVPQWNAKKGAIEILETLKRFDLAVEDFEGSHYNRVSHIKHLLEAGFLDSDLYWRSSE